MYSATAGLMFTAVPVALSVTIAFVICTFDVVLSAYFTSIFPPVKSSVSPCSYSVFVGAVMFIFFTPFFTVILNVVVFPS